MVAEVELQRRNQSGQVVPWNVNDDGTDPVADSVARSRLLDILNRLSEALVVEGTISLDAGALSALESITADIVDDPAREVGRVSTRPSRLIQDFGTRTDAQAIYMGRASPGTAVTSPSWTVSKFRYESLVSSSRLVEFDMRENIRWSNRNDPTADGAQAWDF